METLEQIRINYLLKVSAAHVLHVFQKEVAELLGKFADLNLWFVVVVVAVAAGVLSKDFEALIHLKYKLAAKIQKN